MKRKIIAWLLNLSLLGSLFVPGVPVFADDGGSSGVEISKTATVNDDGTYTITLEAYATGNKIVNEVAQDVPTDIVLVLDQSGSMANAIGTVSFRAYNKSTNEQNYSRRHNGGSSNLYYPLGDGGYASVSVTVEQSISYTKISTGSTNSYYWSNQNNLYALVDGEYQKVTVTYSWRDWETYTYTLPDGKTIATSRGGNSVPTFTGVEGNELYLAEVDGSKSVYTYTYTDTNSETITIGTSTGASTVSDVTLYQKVVDTNSGDSRLEALKKALTGFVEQVDTKAAGKDGVLGTEDDINHRIAVVGFASSDTAFNTSRYENTEVFVGDRQYTYGSSAVSQYGNAFQNMNTTEGQDNIDASIEALDAYGGTFTNLGMEMANGILKANPVAAGEKRNRIVIVFPDGMPGTGTYSNTVGDAAITQGNITKYTYGATVYTVGVFSGADASSAGSKENNATDTQKANWFMQNLSSNNGTVQNPSYYLSAADADTLKSIFKQISEQIEEGGSTIKLGAETVIRDIIAPQFTLPEGATADDITLETWSCTGMGEDGYTWQKNADAMGAVAAVEDDEVSVTGFDFSENYVGTITDGDSVTYHGSKLVIRFTVSTKDGFLGGNNVYTNTRAGIYVDDEAEDPILVFQRPQVNVSIGDVEVTAEDQDVYLLSNVTVDQLTNGVTVQVGSQELDLSMANDTDTPYGLEPWQTEYVNIAVTYYDADGEEITDFNDLTEDQTYTVSVTVTPKFDGTGALDTPNGLEGKSGSDEAEIHVYKPELTFVDEEVYYGDDAPTETALAANLTSTVWKHGDTEADETKMGSAPDLSLTYTPDENGIEDGKIITKQDIPVDVTVQLKDVDVTDETTFLHTDCDGQTCSLPEGIEFLLHVRTCKLSISKNGGTEGESYVFTVQKDGETYTKITVAANSRVTLEELPVGTYSIEEDAEWSWRYTSTYSDESVSLSAQNAEGSITCTNEQVEDSWLNGFSTVVKNVFGVSE